MIEDRIPMPSEEYKKLVCGDCPERFEEIGRDAVEFMKSLGMIEPGTNLLDVGCGCGRVARYLVDEELEGYLGFDRHPGMIQWCEDHITSLKSSFQFEFFDLRSGYVTIDGHCGSLEPSEFRFPFADNRFESALLASVFTHMPINQIDQYLKELARVVGPGGKLLTSVFLAEDEPHDNQIDFWLDSEEWIRAVERHGFSWTRIECEDPDNPQKFFLLTSPSIP
jgi:ubiquinone/menaquinone biosynthesis C-methylase UbiE